MNGSKNTHKWLPKPKGRGIIGQVITLVRPPADAARGALALASTPQARAAPHVARAMSCNASFSALLSVAFAPRGILQTDCAATVRPSAPAHPR
jgi:hypothetical protein